jgi:integrase
VAPVTVACVVPACCLTLVIHLHQDDDHVCVRIITLDAAGPVCRTPSVDEAQLAAAAFLARYSGRTLSSYGTDLRQFFQWAHDVGLTPLDATRAHIELYRATLENKGLAPSTIDRRLSTVCGYYRFAHIDGRIAANPAQCVRRPRVHLPTGEALTGASSRRSSTRMSGPR